MSRGLSNVILNFAWMRLVLHRLLRALANGNRLLVLNELARGGSRSMCSPGALASANRPFPSILPYIKAKVGWSEAAVNRKPYSYEVDHATLAEVKGRLGDIIPAGGGRSR